MTNPTCRPPPPEDEEVDDEAHARYLRTTRAQQFLPPRSPHPPRSLGPPGTKPEALPELREEVVLALVVSSFALGLISGHNLATVLHWLPFPLW